jgi:SNF family Na+-dependent transporter
MSQQSGKPNRKIRETWSSHLGIILAVAGSAIGLGNFLRFPAKAALNGGGAFMIPYFISLLLLGIPLMWIEWTLGRYGGSTGNGTAPAIFHNLSPRSRILKYFGVLGILGPLIIFIYYTYIESWTLAYSFFALTGKYQQITDQSQMQSFLKGFQGLEQNQYFTGLGPAYIFFIITFLINILVIYFGIRQGIEKLSKIAMPILFLCGFILLFRVLTLGTPDPAHPELNVANGFGFLWNPDFSSLKSGRVWLEAAGQIFFTLSVGIGVILTYASYLSRKDDVTLSGLTSVSTNELAEVILGGSIVIPAAFIFFGAQQMQDIAASGIFNLGFVTMPLVLGKLPLAALFGFAWFLLLFLAGVTSSVSLAQPFISFLEDEFNMSKRRAVVVIGVTAFLLCQPAILFLGKGVVDEMDFWGGSVFLVVFALVETILFGWVIGIDKAWKDMHEGARLKVPLIYKFIIKYVTPLYILVILGVWLWQDWLPIITMKNVPAENVGYVLGTRIGILVLFIILAGLVKFSWHRRKLEVEN